MEEENIQPNGAENTTPPQINTPPEKVIGYLESDLNTKSSGRLMKMLSWGMCALIALLFAVPVAVSQILGIFGVGIIIPDITPNNAFLIQTLFFGFLGLAGGTELIQKITGK